MDFNLTLNTEQVNIVLKHLDAGPHREVRALMDNIITQLRDQEMAAQNVAPPPSSLTN